jgi:RimJ/RimL family protein N-acetyltransferase
MQLVELNPPFHSAGIERLIRTDAPTRPRALAVLDGVLAGRVWVDDPASPTAALMIENADGTVWAGGPLTASAVAEALADVETASGDLIFGFADADDPLRALVPSAPYWTGEAIDFTDRQPAPEESTALEPPPNDGHVVVRLDAETLTLIEWYEDTLLAFGSVERWTELGIGFGVLAGDELASEAMAGPRVRGLMEMGVATRERFRGRRYGTLVSRLTARACEARGDRVWWNANARNRPSIAIARRIGFQHERQYELAACRTSTAAGVRSAP